jgi:hypothetical protein
MKTKNTLMANALRLAVTSFVAHSAVNAQALDGTTGVNMNSSGRISNAPTITFPNGTTTFWETTASLQGFMVPAGQFTGLNTNGTAVNYEDLMPLKVSKISIMAGAPGAAPTGPGTVIDADGIEANAISLLGTDAQGQTASVPLTVTNGVLNVSGSPITTNFSSSNVTVGNGLTLNNGVIALDPSVNNNLYNTSGTLTGARQINTGGNRLTIHGSDVIGQNQTKQESLLTFTIPSVPGGRFTPIADVAVGGYDVGPSGAAASSMSFRLGWGGAEFGVNTTPLTLSSKGDGRVGVNVQDPTSALDINGSLTLRGGEPGAGKVLTSDSNGLASWQTLPAAPSAQTLSVSGNSLSLSGGGGAVNVPNLYTSNGGTPDNTWRQVQLGVNSILELSSNSGLPWVPTLAVKNMYAGGDVTLAEFTSNGQVAGSGSRSFIRIGENSGVNNSAELRYQHNGNWSGDNEFSIGFKQNGGNPFRVRANNNVYVSGQLFIDGSSASPGAGKFLTSDANGQATWATIPAPPSAQTLSVSGSSLSLSGGGGTVTVPNLYNTDGALTGSRELSTNGHQLAISGSELIAQQEAKGQSVLTWRIPGVFQNRWSPTADLVVGGYNTGQGTQASSNMSFRLASNESYDMNTMPLTLSSTGGGRVGVNVQDPTSALDVNGSLTLRGGEPGAGKVLTSDSNGLASWQTLPAAPSAQTLSVSGGSLSLSGGGGSVTVPNLFTSDGTLTSSRTVNLGGNPLLFRNGPLQVETQEVFNWGANSPVDAIKFVRSGQSTGRWNSSFAFQMGSRQGLFGQVCTQVSLRLNHGDNSNDPDTTAAVFTGDNGGSMGLGGRTPSTCALEVGGSSAVLLPAGGSGSRPSGDFGMIRYNSDIGRGEMYVNDSNGDGTQGDAGWRAF